MAGIHSSVGNAYSTLHMDFVMQDFNVIIENIAIGAETALSFTNIGFVSLGVLMGVFIGVLPGLGALTAIALLLPLTYQLDAASSLIMLAGIWYGSTFGGSITAILLSIPGTPANAITCIDGYAMTRQGKGSLALFIAVASSFIGGSIGIVVMALLTEPIAKIAISFSSVEYFSLIVLGLIAASSVSNSSVVKGLAMVVIGIQVGTVGTDVYTGQMRFTFDNFDLADGITLVSVSMGVFGVSEIIFTVNEMKNRVIDRKSIQMRTMVPSREQVKKITGPILRASGVGSFLGALPGTGPAISAFVAYALETRIAKDPEKFGKGAIEGVATPEAANNSADITAFIPTLAFGIPGSATMALMLGAMMINGVSPGPALITERPEIFWGLIISFWIGSLIILFLSIPMIGVWIRLLMIPFHILMPAILVFICIGAYSVGSSPMDVWLVLILAVIGIYARYFDFPRAPLILGFVLGPMLEDHFRRAMLISRGDPIVFVESTVSFMLLLVSLAFLIYGLYSGIKSKSKAV